MKIIFIALVLLTTTKPCLAIDNISSNGKSHILGVDFGLGSITPEESSEELDTDSITRLTYGYQFNSTWALNAGVIFGDGNEFCIGPCAEARTLDYNSYILNIKGSLPLSNRWSVFGKLGVNYYNLEISGRNRTSVKDNGVGALLATGLDFRAHNGFGLGLELTLQDMGIITSTNVTFNFSYMF